MIYVRWKKDEPRRVRTFPPLSAGHPSVGDPCPHCERPVGKEEPTLLVAVGPVDADEFLRHDEGRWYNAGAVLLHETCADQLDDPSLERLVAELMVTSRDLDDE